MTAQESGVGSRVFRTKAWEIKVSSAVASCALPDTSFGVNTGTTSPALLSTRGWQGLAHVPDRHLASQPTLWQPGCAWERGNRVSKS